MSTSLPFCDIILPDLMYQERMNMVSTVTGGSALGFVFGRPVQEPQFECRLSYDWVADLAERRCATSHRRQDMGGMDGDPLRGVQSPLGPHGTAPCRSREGLEMGFRAPSRPSLIALQRLRRTDPEGRPRTTPSGKIELYSERLATIRDTWTFHNGERDVVRPVPSYFPEIEGVADVNETYPLLFSTWKAKNQFHSRY